MKLKVSSKELKNALAKLSTVPGATTDRVIKVAADMEGATLIRQTVSSQMNATLDCEIEDTGEAFIDSNWLQLFVNKVDGDIDMTLEKDKLLVSCEKMKSHINVIREGYTFDERKGEEGVSWKIETGRLFDIIEATSPAMATEDVRKECAGLLIQKQEDGHVWCGGTDGRRAHVLRTNAKDELFTLIPTEVVKCLHKVLLAENRETKVKFSIGERTVSLESPGTLIVSQLYADKIQPFKPFLDIKQEDDSAVIVANRRLLMDHVLAAMGFSKLKQVSLKAKGKKLTIEAELPDGADFTSEIALEKKASIDFEMTINGQYFTDLLRSVKSQEIELTTVKQGLGIWHFGGDIVLGVIAIRNKPASENK